jgi:hypothetical protein
LVLEAALRQTNDVIDFTLEAVGRR